jgi:large subunit ribosomal protein L24e
MAASRQRKLARRKKVSERASSSIKLVQPLPQGDVKVREKIKVPVMARSALVPGEGRSMAMEVD